MIGYRVVPPLIRRDVKMGTCGVEAEGMDGGEVLFEIGAETVPGNEGAVPVNPIGIQQMGVRVRA